MKLIYYKLNLEIELSDNSLNMLIIENSRELEDFINAINERCNKNDFGVELFEETDKLDFEKNIDFIRNSFDLNYEKKEVQKKLYSILLEEIRSSSKEDKFYSLCENFSNIMEDLNYSIEYNLEYEEDFGVNNLLKSFNVHLEAPKGYFVEKFIEYSSNLQSILNKDVYILVSCLQYLTEEDLKYLEKHAKYRKIKILLIENKDSGLKEGVAKYIIDKDICEIY